MTLQLLTSEFPYHRGNFFFFFISVVCLVAFRTIASVEHVLCLKNSSVAGSCHPLDREGNISYASHYDAGGIRGYCPRDVPGPPLRLHVRNLRRAGGRPSHPHHRYYCYRIIACDTPVSYITGLIMDFLGNNFANFYKSERRREQIEEKKKALEALKREGLITPFGEHIRLTIPDQDHGRGHNTRPGPW